MHALTPAQIDALRAMTEQSDVSPAVRERLRWILHFLEHGHSVTETCAVFDISRSTFHRWLKRFDPHDLSTLDDLPTDPEQVRQSAVPAEVVAWIRGYREASPLIGKERIAQLLQVEHGVTLSASSVGRVIDREGLYFADTPLHWKKRSVKHVGFTAQAPVRQETAQAPAPAPMPSAGPLVPVHVALASLSGPFKRALLVASLLVNVALLASLLTTALWETQTAASVSVQSPPFSSARP
jgi:transposase